MSRVACVQLPPTNPNGHLDSLSYPANLIVDFQPNALGQATQAVSATTSFATNALYHPNGAVKQFTYGNGMVHRMTQNARQLPAVSCDAYSRSTICGDSGAIAFLYDEYTYDHNGNVFAITDLSYGRNQRGNRSMVYDDLDRLTNATSPMWSGTASYTYDALDNIVNANVPTTLMSPARNWAYCYDTANRIDKIRNGTCSGSLIQELTHDPQGNVSAKGGTSYGFDFGNRLRSAGTESYRYDAHGRRTKVTSTSGNLYHLYGQGGQLFWTRDERDNQRRQFVYLAGSLIAEHTRAIGSSTEVITYQHTDALGSPVVKTKPTRSRTYHEYEPYGALANGANPDLPGYTGHVMDAGTGLTYMQQRYYDPKLGVFLSVDPVTANGSAGTNFNRYWYASNNPYKFTDPDGRFVLQAGGAAGGAVAGFVMTAGADLLSGRLSSRGTYAGAIAGGAAAGAVLASTGSPTLAGAAGGALSSIVRQSTDNGIAHINADDVALATVGGALLGHAAGGTSLKVPGITSGRNSYSAVAKSAQTKLNNGTIQHVSNSTIAKASTAAAVSGAPSAAINEAANRGVSTVNGVVRDVVNEGVSVPRPQVPSIPNCISRACAN